MNKKNIYQLILLLLIFIIIGGSYYYYQSQNINLKKNSIIKKQEKFTDNENDNSNVIQDLEYTSMDSLGNNYKINSKFGKLDPENPDIIIMSDVIAIIQFRNSEVITIFSKSAKYNKKTNETNFMENVELKYKQHHISSVNLDLSFENNLASMSNEVVYTYLSTKLIADRLEIDLITKNSKIYMHDSEKKVKILGKN